MKAAKCPVCDYTDENSDQESSRCLRCGSDFTGSVMEKKLMEASGTYTAEDKQFFGKMGTNAALYLTDRRFLAIPEKLEGFNVTTALTAAVVNKMTSKLCVVSIPLEEIKEVREGKFGLLAKAIVIEAENGELLKITVPRQKEWKEAIRKAAPNLP